MSSANVIIGSALTVGIGAVAALGDYGWKLLIDESYASDPFGAGLVVAGGIAASCVIYKALEGKINDVAEVFFSVLAGYFLSWGSINLIGQHLGRQAIGPMTPVISLLAGIVLATAKPVLIIMPAPSN